MKNRMVDPEYLRGLEQSSAKPPKPGLSFLILKWTIVVILFVEAASFAYFITTSFQMANQELELWQLSSLGEFKRGQCITVFMLTAIVVLSLLLKITFLYGIIAQMLWLAVLYSIFKSSQALFAWSRAVVSAEGSNVACAFHETGLALSAIAYCILLRRYLGKIRRYRHDQFVYLFHTEN